MRFKTTFFAAACLLFTPAVFAATQTVDQKVEKTLRAKLKELIPEQGPSSIRKSPVGDWYEVAYDTQIVYMSPDGRYILQGSILDLVQKVDLTEQAKGASRKAALSKVDEKSMFVFAPKKTAHTITVFTDVDCQYCRKMHAEIDEYLKRGIKVRYMMFPRAGLGSPSFDKAVSAWCADDRNVALTKAKSGSPIKQAHCDSPIAQQFELGAKLGVRGTPAIVTESGDLFMGYKSAAELVALFAQISAPLAAGQDANAAR